MFSQSGYFQSFICPFFKEENCTRVYCLFKHEKKASTFENETDSTPMSLLRGFGLANKRLERKTSVAKVKSNKKVVSYVPQYIPTPKPILENRRFNEIERVTLADVSEVDLGSYSPVKINTDPFGEHIRQENTSHSSSSLLSSQTTSVIQNVQKQNSQLSNQASFSEANAFCEKIGETPKPFDTPQTNTNEKAIIPHFSQNRTTNNVDLSSFENTNISNIVKIHEKIECGSSEFIKSNKTITKKYVTNNVKKTKNPETNLDEKLLNAKKNEEQNNMKKCKMKGATRNKIRKIINKNETNNLKQKKTSKVSDKNVKSFSEVCEKNKNDGSDDDEDESDEEEEEEEEEEDEDDEEIRKQLKIEKDKWKLCKKLYKENEKIRKREFMKSVLEKMSTKDEDVANEGKTNNENNYTDLLQSKKRVAHSNHVPTRLLPKKPKLQPSPRQVMMSRYKEIATCYNKKNINVNNKNHIETYNSIKNLGNYKTKKVENGIDTTTKGLSNLASAPQQTPTNHIKNVLKENSYHLKNEITTKDHIFKKVCADVTKNNLSDKIKKFPKNEIIPINTLSSTENSNNQSAIFFTDQSHPSLPPIQSNLLKSQCSEDQCVDATSVPRMIPTTVPRLNMAKIKNKSAVQTKKKMIEAYGGGFQTGLSNKAVFIKNNKKYELGKIKIPSDEVMSNKINNDVSSRNSKNMNNNAKAFDGNAPNVEKSPTSSLSKYSALSSKGLPRVAHAPSKKLMSQPMPRHLASCQIALHTRQNALSKLIDVCVQIYPDFEDSVSRALAEEETLANQSSKSSYLSKCTSVLLRLKRELKMDKSNNNLDCSEYTVRGPTRNISYVQITLTEEGLYKGLKKYLATESQLKSSCFPHYVNGKVTVLRDHFSEKNYPKSLGEGRQECRRCNKIFIVKPNVSYPKRTCIYHPRSRFRRGNRFIHGCCNSDNDGCSMCDCHVYSSNVYEDLSGYVKTLPPIKQSSCHGIFSVDCEMLYTEGGMELGRVTVVDWKGKVVLDKLKKPEHPVVDYNTAYSGLTKVDMDKATLSHPQIQALVLSIINEDSILVGHSLSSDLLFLKMVHGKVVDTTIVFPNSKGPQYKHSLKFLASNYLTKFIQESAAGHDSTEDAKTCLHLMEFKVRQDVAAGLRCRLN